MLHWKNRVAVLMVTAVAVAAAIGGFAIPFPKYGFYW
jgi:hypothetical protein